MCRLGNSRFPFLEFVKPTSVDYKKCEQKEELGEQRRRIKSLDHKPLLAAWIIKLKPGHNTQKIQVETYVIWNKFVES